MHHGNGTEDGFLHNSSLFYGSTHELDNFPGTGRQPSLEAVKPLEMDTLRELVANDVLFDQLFDLTHDSLWKYTQHKPPYLVSRDHPSALTQRIVDRQIPSGKRSRYDFRIKWREILYEMLWFGPSLVIISAGFDAHHKDPLADLELTEEDYYWATEACLLACRCCDSMKRNGATRELAESDGANQRGNVKCLSILEGGYHVEAISKSSVSHVDALFKSLYGYSLEAIAEVSVAKESEVAVKTEDQSPGHSLPAEGEIGVAPEGGTSVRSLDDILSDLDSSITNLFMEALLSVSDPASGEEERSENENEDATGAAEERSPDPPPAPADDLKDMS